MTEETEEDLIVLCQKGELENFALLYDFYIQKIYDFVFYKTHHKQIAEDLTSSAFLKALESIKKFDLKKGKFASWLYRIARNTIIDHYRTQKRVYNISDAWELSSAADPLKDIANREELEKVRLFLQKLTPEQRDVILLRVWSNLSYAEIAEIMGKSEANCRMLFSRAISRIKTEKIFTILILLPLIKLFN